MRKIKMIGILTILVIIAENVFWVTGNLRSAADGFIDGWNSVEDSTASSVSHLLYFTTEVRQLAEVQDSLYNTSTGEKIPYSISQITTGVETPFWIDLFIPALVIAALAYLYGFYCLIRLLISVTRREVFTVTNVSRIRFFAYAQVVILVLAALHEWLLHRVAVGQLELPGFEILNTSPENFDWMLPMIVILFTEIFAAGVKIKEEQDLTI